jgi:zinc protease
VILFLLAPLALADPSTPEETDTHTAASEHAIVEGAAEQSPIARALNLRPQVEELSNGLIVVLHENRRSPTVNLTTLVRVGSADDPQGASGLAHLFEHLMFKGSPNAPGTEWGRLLEEAGAESKGWTERDWTLYQTSGPSSALERLLFLESDRLGWLAESVEEESLTIELDVIANERASREGDQSLFFSELHRHLWPTTHPSCSWP